MTKGLKTLEKIKEYRGMNLILDCGKDVDTIENELKALEIIIKKIVDIGWLIYHTKDVNDYNRFIPNRKNMLTKKEYNLLIETMKTRALR